MYCQGAAVLPTPGLFGGCHDWHLVLGFDIHCSSPCIVFHAVELISESWKLITGVVSLVNVARFIPS